MRRDATVPMVSGDEQRARNAVYAVSRTAAGPVTAARARFRAFQVDMAVLLAVAGAGASLP